MTYCWFEKKGRRVSGKVRTVPAGQPCMISQFSVHQLSGRCSAAVPAASAGRMPALREGALSSHFLDTTLGAPCLAARTSEVVDKCWKGLIWFDTSLRGAESGCCRVGFSTSSSVGLRNSEERVLSHFPEVLSAKFFVSWEESLRASFGPAWLELSIVDFRLPIDRGGAL